MFGFIFRGGRPGPLGAMRDVVATVLMGSALLFGTQLAWTTVDRPPRPTFVTSDATHGSASR